MQLWEQSWNLAVVGLRNETQYICSGLRTAANSWSFCPRRGGFYSSTFLNLFYGPVTTSINSIWWDANLSNHWQLLFLLLKSSLHAMRKSKQPWERPTWRKVVAPADIQHQIAIHVKEPSGKWTPHSQPSLPSWQHVEQRWAIPAELCPDCKGVSK